MKSSNLNIRVGITEKRRWQSDARKAKKSLTAHVRDRLNLVLNPPEQRGHAMPAVTVLDVLPK